MDFLIKSGHPAVMVFFILSGYVISYVTSERETQLDNYVAARLARLYSVLLPALILTVIFDTIGTSLDPTIYNPNYRDLPVIRVIAAAVFMNAFWAWNIETLSNTPFWSLPYEFWYYAAFGIVMYLRGWVRSACLFLAILLMGPKIWLYAPIWLGGVVLHRYGPRFPLHRLQIPVAIVSAVLFVALIPVAGATYYDSSWLPNGFSFVDYIMASCILIHLWAAQSIDLSILQPYSSFVRSAASITFALYLTHLPLIFLLLALLPDWPEPVLVALSTIATLGLAIGLTGPTDYFRNWLREKLPSWWAMVRRVGRMQPEG